VNRVEELEKSLADLMAAHYVLTKEREEAIRQHQEVLVAYRSLMDNPYWPDSNTVRTLGDALAIITREGVAKWMIRHGYATSHGDTLDDLMFELVGRKVDKSEGRGL
jgi:hypothetical protein